WSTAITRIPGTKVDIFTRSLNPNFRRVKVISPNIRIIHLKAGPESPVDRRDMYPFIPEFAENLAHFMEKEEEKYDLIYSHYWLSGLAGLWIKKRFHLPLIQTYHTLAFLKRKYHDLGREHEKRFEAEEHLASLSDGIVSSSEQEKRHLVEYYRIPSDKVRVIYPGVNGKLFHTLSDQIFPEEMEVRKGECVLLYVGRIEPVKGLMTVIDAFYLLGERRASLFDHVKLVVIGGGREHPDLVQNSEVIRIRDMIEKRRLERKVIFLGSKKQSELKVYYSAAEALVVPSLYESFGLVIIEALACGTPVIVSRIGEMATIVKEGRNGWTFCPNNPSSLASSIELFCAQKERLWAKEKISQDIRGRFSWEKTARQTHDLFKEIFLYHHISTR
ncbi:MAG: glycosyltransferase, partial [Candidatus Aminicenantales bacterium]